jgi:hypothetical protein
MNQGLLPKQMARQADNDDSCGGPQPDPTVHLKNYQYVSQFSTDQVCGISIFIAGNPGDPDGNVVQVYCYDINGPQNVTITAVSGDGTTVTFTAANTLTAGGGQQITFSGLGGGFSAFNTGVYTVLSASPTSFTITSPVTGGTTTGMGTGAAFIESATRTGVGQYQITLSSYQTDTPGYFTLVWNFEISSNPQQVDTYFQVGAENPDYDILPQPMKDIIQITWGRFSDMFDSPQGGPHLQVYFQSNFSVGRLAQLLNIALGYLNTMAQPYTTFTLTNAATFPYWQWGPLLEQGLYIETLKHLIRSYTEMPSLPGVTVSLADRRDYIDRWSSILQMELPMFKSQLDTFKISMMGLGRPKVLVSGGAYGNIGFTRIPGSAAPRGMLFSRFWF